MVAARGLGLALACVPFAGETATAQVGNAVVFERVQNISADEFAVLVAPVAIRPRSGGSLRVWQADAEQGVERKDGRTFYGIIAADSDFLGEGSVVMRIWAEPDVVFLQRLSETASQDSKIAVATFGPLNTNCMSKNSLACAQSLSHVQIDGAGHVSANGVIVGKVLK